MNLILEFDDFHHKSPENCLKTIYWLLEKVPNIKMSFFTTPRHSRIPLIEDKDWCAQVRKLCSDGNIVLGVHGLEHTRLEFGAISYEEAIKKMVEAEREFQKAELPYKLCWRSPQWAINKATYEALIDLNYKSVFSHQDYKVLADKFPIPTHYYNWNLKDEENDIYWDVDQVIAHGHTHNVCDNGIEQTRYKIFEFCQKYKPDFKFIHEI